MSNGRKKKEYFLVALLALKARSAGDECQIGYTQIKEKYLSHSPELLNQHEPDKFFSFW